MDDKEFFPLPIRCARLKAENLELLDALRELNKFAAIDYWHIDESKRAFDNAAKLLSRLDPKTEGLKINESR